MKKVAVIITGIVEIVFYLRWLTCQKLEDRFHYSAFDLKLRIEEAVHNDREVPLTMVRAFHNKVVGTLIDLVTEVTQYFDILFLVNLLSPLGMVYFFCGLYYGVKKLPRKLFFLMIGWLFVFPLIETLFMPSFSYAVKLFLIALPFVVFSLLGVWHFFQSKDNRMLRIGIFVVLSVLSILWYTVFPKDLYTFCLPK